MQIGLLKNALQKAGLPLYLAPYGVLPTAYECGIIEVQSPETLSGLPVSGEGMAGLFDSLGFGL